MVIDFSTIENCSSEFLRLTTAIMDLHDEMVSSAHMYFIDPKDKH